MESAKLRALLTSALFLCLNLPAWATWTIVQHKVNTACTLGTNQTTCAVTVSSTGTGNVIAIIVVGETSSNGSTQHISSVSGGGTYTHCTNCQQNVTNGCGVGTFCWIDGAYTLSSSSGTTSITVTMASKVGSSGVWRLYAVEASFTGSPVGFDASGSSAFTGTPASTTSGIALTLAGTSDLIIQAIGAAQTIVSIDGSYAIQDNNTTTIQTADATAINTSSGTAPTWTLGTIDNNEPLAAMAFKETVAAATCSPTLAKLGVGKCG